MLSSKALFLTLLAGTTSAIPTADTQTSSLTRRGADAYVNYVGDGSPASGWPAMSSWTDWETMFNANKPLMRTGCSRIGIPVAESTEDEIGKIWDAVQTVSAESGVDQRFIFAIILQESLGCVRVWQTDSGGVTNPGIMQTHNGQNSCNTGLRYVGQVQIPCPWNVITGMVRDGVEGTGPGTGLKDILAQTKVQVGAADARPFYAAARLYNSGSIDVSKLEDPFASTACYASDVANRLTGWSLAPNLCSHK